MNQLPREPLDADERALAARLARDPVASPPPALDAAIVAASRADAAQTDAVQATVPAAAPDRDPPAQRPRPRRRWPFGVGVAAALLVAVGVSWQLRPLPDAHPGTWSDVAEAPQARQLESAPVVPADPVRQAPAAAPRVESVRVRDVVERAPPPAPASPAVAAAPPPAPPSPPAPPAAADIAATDAARSTAFGAEAVASPRAATSAPEAAARTASAVAAPQAARRASVAMFEAIEDVPDDDQPPASADSPEVQRAWLERVRELLDTGDIAAARASLGEFHRRHPDAELPPDLRALLD